MLARAKAPILDGAQMGSMLVPFIKAAGEMKTKPTQQSVAKLREIGSSLEKQRRAFAEQVLAKEMIRQQIDRDEEVTHEEMLARYRARAADPAPGRRSLPGPTG